MKILQVIDFSGWAIGALASDIALGNQHHTFEMIEIHPKDLRNDTDHYIKLFQEKIELFKPDIVHFHYWDTARTLRQYCGSAKVILTHHNQKNLTTHSWEDFDVIAVHTKKAQAILNQAGYNKVTVIPHGIDIEFFKFNEQYDPESKVVGYVGRIVPWKNPEKVLEAVKNVGAECLMMGRIDKGDTWNQCLKYEDVMDIRFKTEREDQPKTYHEMSVYVGFSDDNIEEGPLGLLEAMACGVPVITTLAGEAADFIKDGENGLVVEFGNTENLTYALKKFFSMSPEEKNELREKGWDAVKGFSKQKMAWNYEKLYYKTLFEKDLVSVIIPTHNRAETLPQVIRAFESQTYRPLELVICDDGSTDNTLELAQEMAQEASLPIKWVETGNQGYGLAQARNMGVYEASGHYLFFNDDRMEPAPSAVEVMVKRLSSIKTKSAVWGDKGAGKRHFIENFFVIRKKHLVQAGLFNERIDRYGGMSQEIRARLLAQGFNLQYEPDGKARTIFGTRRNKRRYDIFNMKLRLWKADN